MLGARLAKEEGKLRTAGPSHLPAHRCHSPAEFRADPQQHPMGNPQPNTAQPGGSVGR